MYTLLRVFNKNLRLGVFVRYMFKLSMYVVSAFTIRYRLFAVAAAAVACAAVALAAAMQFMKNNLNIKRLSF